MWNWLKSLQITFVDDCRLWYKRWSTWLAVVWGVIGVVFWNIPTWLPQLLAVMPPEMRAILSPVVLFVLAGLPVFIVNLKQGNLKP